MPQRWGPLSQHCRGRSALFCTAAWWPANFSLILAPKMSFFTRVKFSQEQFVSKLRRICFFVCDRFVVFCQSYLNQVRREAISKQVEEGVFGHFCLCVLFCQPYLNQIWWEAVSKQVEEGVCGYFCLWVYST